MTSETVARNEPSGLKVWFAVCGGIGAWITHLIAEASLARRTCTSGEDWVVHAITVALVLVTVAAMVLSAQLRVTEGPPRGELHFLGTLGLLLGAVNLLLIVFEGALLFWIPTCG